jgi:hypothetical protein
LCGSRQSQAGGFLFSSSIPSALERTSAVLKQERDEPLTVNGENVSEFLSRESPFSIVMQQKRSAHTAQLHCLCD